MAQVLRFLNGVQAIGEDVRRGPPMGASENRAFGILVSSRDEQLKTVNHFIELAAGFLSFTPRILAHVKTRRTMSHAWTTTAGALRATILSKKSWR